MFTKGLRVSRYFYVFAYIWRKKIDTKTKQYQRLCRETVTEQLSNEVETLEELAKRKSRRNRLSFYHHSWQKYHLETGN